MGGLLSQGASEILLLKKKQLEQTILGKRGVREKKEILKPGNGEVDKEEPYSIYS